MSISTFQNVTKKYPGDITALHDVSFAIERDQIIGLLGRNGAGKTTLVNCLMGFIRQTSGRITVFDEAPGKACSRIGYIPDIPDFHQKETVFFLLMKLAHMRQIDKKMRRRRVEETIEKFGLNTFAERKLWQLSKGMLQRFNVAQGMIGDPDLVVMDEPLSGLDPFGQSEMISIIGQMRRPGRSLLISSHLLFHLEKVCGQVLILDKGRVKFFGSPHSDISNKRTVIRLSQPATGEQLSALKKMGAEVIGPREIELNHQGKLSHQFLRYLADNEMDIESLTKEQSSYEQLLFNLINQ